jgi:hypothetical protein
MEEPYPIETYIARPPSEVTAFLNEPRNYPRWAVVSEKTFRQIGPLEWAADTALGPRIVRFSPTNDEGIADHAVYAEGKVPRMMPLRITAQGDGALLTFGFYRPAGMTDEQFASAIEWIRTDFEVLKALLEA